jgi:hypothetical protein
MLGFFVRSASETDIALSVDPETMRRLRSDTIADRLQVARDLVSGISFGHGQTAAGPNAIDLKPLLATGVLSAQDLRIAFEKGEVELRHAELLLRYIRIYSAAVEAFGKANGQRWLGTANRALAGMTPVALLSTEDGGRAVATLLGRIEYGIAS